MMIPKTKPPNVENKAALNLTNLVVRKPRIKPKTIEDAHTTQLTQAAVFTF